MRFLLAVLLLGITTALQAQSAPLNTGYNLVSPVLPGYSVTSPLVSGSKSLVGNPTGSSFNFNFLISAWNPAFPDFTEIDIFLGGSDYTTNFATYYSDSGSPTGWDDINFEPVAAPNAAIGQGFYILPEENTSFTLGSGPIFSGSVNGQQLQIQDGFGALSPVPDGSTLVFFNGTGFVTDLVNSVYPSGFTDSLGVPLLSPPPLPIGQGFFIQLNGGPMSPSLVFPVPGTAQPFNALTLVWD